MQNKSNELKSIVYHTNNQWQIIIMQINTIQITNSDQMKTIHEIAYDALKCFFAVFFDVFNTFVKSISKTIAKKCC